MQRAVERQRNLPAFSINLGELEVLWERLLTLFEYPDKVHGIIEILLPTEKLKFDNLEELKRYTQLRGRIANFRIYFAQGDRGISIASSSSIGVSSLRFVRAVAENKAWCAGAVETVYSFLRSHKVWYLWFGTRFGSVLLGLIFLVLSYAPYITRLYFHKDTDITNPVLATWLTITLAFAILLFTNWKLLPSTLCITEEEGFTRRHIGELTFIVALLALAVAGIQLVLQLAGIIH